MRLIRRSLILMLAVLVPGTALASQLVWTQAGSGGNDWETGETGNLYTVDGIDLDFSITDNNTPPAIDPGGGPLSSPGAPSTDPYLSDGGANAGPNLFIKAPGNTGSVVIDLVFSQQVSSVSFSMFDVDATGISGVGSFQDILLMQGFLGAALVAPASVTGTGAGSIWNLTNPFTVTAVENASQNDPIGTVNIDFVAPLDSIRITYTNGDLSAGVQWVGLSHVTFVAAPEPSTALLVSFGLIVLAIRRR